MVRLTASLTLILTLMAARAATAATPLPSPPFVGGFVAPALAQMIDEQRTSRALFSYTRKYLDCHLTALSSLSRAAGDSARIATAVSRFGTCLAAAEQKLLAVTSKLLARGNLGVCLNSPAIVGLQHDLEISDLGGLDVIACDGPIEPFTQLHVPTSKDFTRGEVSFGKAYGTTVEKVGRCFDNAALAIARANGDPADVAAALAKHTVCAQKASDAGHARVQKLLDGGLLPACNAGSAQAEIDVAATIGGGLTGDIYCGQ